MSLKIVVVADKFKGTLTAAEAAEAIARGWRQSRPKDVVEALAMSDGGDGFGEVMARLLDAKPQHVQTVDAAHRPLNATWWWAPRTRTALIEAAQVIGLALLPPGKYHPFELDSSGLGALFQAASEHRAQTCLVGIGGSATNDAGFGLARSLGWKFFNAGNRPIERWTELHRLSTIEPPSRVFKFREVRVAVDVQNPLLGPQGATRIYGPQKGIQTGDFEFCERCLSKFAAVLKQELHLDYQDCPGSGAAGGLGFGLQSCLGARLVPGFELYEPLAQLPARLAGAGMVLTAEGALDTSTLMGKGVGEVAKRCRQLAIPCLGLGGMVKSRAALEKWFTRVEAITPKLASRAEAMDRPAFWLEKLAADVAAGWNE